MKGREVTVFKEICRKIICLGLCLVMLFAMADVALCEEKTTTVETEFYSVILKKPASWQFEYSDHWFEADADAYSHSIARASLGLAVSAFRAKSEPVDGNVLAWLTKLGFTDIISVDYNAETSIDTIGTVIGHKQLPSGETLLAVSTCGQGYQNEWLSNLDIGDQQEHRGFSSASQKVVQRVESYMQEHELSNTRLWLSGFSRSAAVANLAGASLMEKGLFTEKNAFIYTFATPNVTRSPVAYSNIFNIVGKFDPVSCIPFQEWGFDRNGNTFYTPAQETDSDYRKKMQAADVPFHKLTGLHMWNDPVMNQHLAAIEAYLLSSVPTTADYDQHMKEPVAEAWGKTNLGAIYSVLGAMQSIPAKDPSNNISQKRMVSELIDYAFSATFNVLGDDQTFVGLAESGLVTPAMMLEHTPEIYLAWMFSSEDPEDIFTDKMLYTQLVVSGEAEIHLLDRRGDFIMSMDPDGVVNETTQNERYLNRISPEEDKPLIMAMNANGKNIFVLPKDQVFMLAMTALDDSDLEYYSIHYDICQSAPTLSSVRLLHMEPETEYLAFSLTPNGQALLNVEDPLWGDAHEIDWKFEPGHLLSVFDVYELGGMNAVRFSVKGTIITLIAATVILLAIAVLLLVKIIRLCLRLLRKHGVLKQSFREKPAEKCAMEAGSEKSHHVSS